jgi:hypothetical protein
VHPTSSGHWLLWSQGLRPTRLGEGGSSVRYDGVQGVATQGLRPTPLGEDDSSVRYELGGGSREALEQRIAGQQGRWQRQGHGIWQELEQDRVRRQSQRDYEEKECADVQDIPTPPSPPQF